MLRFGHNPAWVLLLVCCLASTVGCTLTDPQAVPSPIFDRPPPEAPPANPVLVPVPQSPEAYGELFEMVLDVMDDYFEIQASNRFDGTIVCFPRIAPGVGQFFKNGSPTTRERVLATLQTIRHRAEVQIQPVPNGAGYLIAVRVLKELEDLPRPARPWQGSAAFRSDNTVDRTPDVVNPDFVNLSWIPQGRDVRFEQNLLKRIANFQREKLVNIK